MYGSDSSGVPVPSEIFRIRCGNGKRKGMKSNDKKLRRADAVPAGKKADTGSQPVCINKGGFLWKTKK